MMLTKPEQARAFLALGLTAVLAITAISAPAEPDAEANAIEAEGGKWARYYENEDLQGLMTLYVDDVVVALHGQPALYGKEAGILPLVRAETVRQQLYVAVKLVSTLVWKGVVVISCLQALLHQAKKYAIRHFPVACGYSVVGVLEESAVVFDPLQDFRVDANPRFGLAQLRRNRGALPVIQIEDQ